jgi:hypothetical protein
MPWHIKIINEDKSYNCIPEKVITIEIQHNLHFNINIHSMTAYGTNDNQNFKYDCGVEPFNCVDSL